MFENLLYQNASQLLKEDILKNRLPGAILLSGPEASGKLTCALEIARILSCTGTPDHNEKGSWNCTCSSCLKSKELSDQNLLLAGPRDCLLEVFAAKKTFLNAAYNNSTFLPAARYLFIRSVRKLTLRFSQFLWEDDDKDIKKISPLTLAISDELEKLSPARELPENDDIQKICDSIEEYCKKLSSFLYSSLPISQIRKASAWTRLKSVSGKKVFIIENADRMLEGVRNALLKILEEPPEDLIFILTTSNRGAVMPTILSRVRTYNFSERNLTQQQEVIDRVFHAGFKDDDTIEKFLQTYLPLSRSEIKKTASDYLNKLMNGQILLADSISKACSGFEPQILFRLFLQGILEETLDGEKSPSKIEAALKISEFVRECYNNVNSLNQKPSAAIEKLTRDLSSVKKLYLS